MTGIVDKLLTGLLGVAALSIAAVELHREFSTPVTQAGMRRSEYVSSWRSMLSSARVIGNPDAPVTIVEFADFECPFCRRLNSTLAILREKYPGRTATALIHYPLSIHKNALSAARAVECAAASGKLADAVNLIFEQQDSLGKKSWSSLAHDAGVSDTTRFLRCMSDTTATRLVQRGMEVGSKAGVNATPTVILNGWRYGVAPSDTELIRAVGDILAGRRPYRGFPKAGMPVARGTE